MTNPNGSSAMVVRRGHVLAVLLANAILWAAAIVVSGNVRLGGAAFIGLISIGSLLRPRSA